MLAASSAIILGKLFCARIDEMPVGGVRLVFEEGLVFAALGSALFYLLCAFIAYARIDWNNRGKTPATRAEEEARQAVLVDAERSVRAVAKSEARRHGVQGANMVVDRIAEVFWEFKNNSDVGTELLHAALTDAGIPETAFANLTETLRDAWGEVAQRTKEERERAEKSKRHEYMRFWLLEVGLPLSAALVAIVVFFLHDVVRGWFGCISCELV